MGISIDSIWNKAQRLSASERLALSRKLRDSVSESDVERQERTASEIDRFFGGWNEDPRTTEEIMQQIREGRTANTSCSVGFVNPTALNMSICNAAKSRSTSNRAKIQS